MTDPTVKLVTQPVALAEVEKLAKDGFGELVKAVVDIDQRVMVESASIRDAITEIVNELVMADV